MLQTNMHSKMQMLSWHTLQGLPADKATATLLQPLDTCIPGTNVSVLLHCQVLHLTLQVCCACTTISHSRLGILPDEDAPLTTHTDHCALVRSHSHACTP